MAGNTSTKSKSSKSGNRSGSGSSQRSQTNIEDITALTSDITGTLKEYARERPDMVALWCFGIGFVLGWKLKPW